jgi:Zn-dependent protease with chaperone function
MNFARHQARAERAGRSLLGLHALATVVVIFAVDAVATLLWHLLFGWAAEPPRGFHATNVGVVVLLVVGGGWLETMRLREDGAIVAHRLGAVAADPASDVLHRRLQNLLEELAIVARIGVPRAFVLEDEPTINALTAGMDRNHAIVVVTRGALERLTRDELQGVLAHEVSHVVNGDVRLNTRLIGMNHGLQWVSLAGRSLLGAALRRAQGLGPVGLLAAAPMALAGAVLRLVGELGAIAARAIQAGIGRQREYFADAQAIAFTRSRDGLGGALRKIAGQAAVLRREAAAAGIAPPDPRRAAAVRHPYWQNVAHLLLSGMVSSRRWFETHPPLRERVRRLYGRAMPPIEPRALDEPERREPELPALQVAITDGDGGALDAAAGASRTAPAPPGLRSAWSDTVPVEPSGEVPDTAHAAPVFEPGALPGSALIEGVRASASARLVQATRAPAGAAALVVALVETPGQRAPEWDPGWAGAAARLPALRESLAMLPPEAVHSLRWPLMELAAAQLRPLSRPSRETLLVTVRGIVEADGRVTLREWIHFGLLRLRLSPQPHSPRFPGLADPADARCVRVLFALVAQCAQVSEAKADRAANAAIRALDLAPIGGSAGPLTLDALDGAVRRAARLPPLDRPLLVRRLAAMLPSDAGAEVRDFLRLLCVAIDCPAPRLAQPDPAPRARDVDEPADVEA